MKFDYWNTMDLALFIVMVGGAAGVAVYYLVKLKERLHNKYLVRKGYWWRKDLLN